MKIVHRYVSLEILRVFFLTLGLFIFVILMDRASSIAETVLGQGVSALDFFSVLIKAVPAFLGITIPMSFVLSVLIVFIQMGSNNELVALKSCGVSLRELSKPVFALGLLFSLLSFFSLMFLMPKSNVAMKKEIEELLKKKITMSITPKSFSSNFPGVTFYAEKIYPKRGYLENFMVTLQKGNELVTIFAKKGILRTEENTVFLDIEDGSAQVLSWQKPSEFKLLSFKNYTVKLYKFSEREQFKAVKYKDLFQLLSMDGKEPKVELVKRAGLAFAPVIVGVLAFSIATLIPRGSLGTGVVLSLVIIVTYYILYTLSKKIALKSGLVFLPLLPDVLFLAVTAYLYRQAVKETLRLDIGGRW
jgi:lipopolysaccharide export system permease protein